MAKHASGDSCPSCQEKIKTAHPYVQEWWGKVKKAHPEAHISWAFRDEKSQNAAYREGKSKLEWPDSPHNHEENGQPCSLALDLFQLSTQGNAIWNYAWFKALGEKFCGQGSGMRWGIKSLGDYDHYQMRLPERVQANS